MNPHPKPDILSVPLAFVIVLPPMVTLLPGWQFVLLLPSTDIVTTTMRSLATGPIVTVLLKLPVTHA
jgi:hypothetical protein